MTKLLTYGGHHIYTYGRYFRADTVTGQNSNLKIHNTLLFFICGSSGVQECRQQSPAIYSPVHVFVIVSLLLSQCLFDVSDEVLNILDTYRKTDKVGSDTSLTQLFVRELAMSVTSRMEHT